MRVVQRLLKWSYSASFWTFINSRNVEKVKEVVLENFSGKKIWVFESDKGECDKRVESHILSVYKKVWMSGWNLVIYLLLRIVVLLKEIKLICLKTKLVLFTKSRFFFIITCKWSVLPKSQGNSKHDIF